MTHKHEPSGELLIVRPIDADAEAIHSRPKKGRVVAVGDGRGEAQGAETPLDVSPGDEILYERYGGQGVTIDGEELLVLRQSDVLGRSAHQAPARASGSPVREGERSSERLARLRAEAQASIEELRELVK
jgi:chaperonin GroES